MSITSLNAYQEGGPILDKLKSLWEGIRGRGKDRERPRNIPVRDAMQRDAMSYPDTLVGQPREDLYNLLDLQEEGAYRPEGGQQMLLDMWGPDSPTADSLAVLQQQLTGDTLPSDIRISIPERNKGWSGSWRMENPWYAEDITDSRRDVDPDLPVPAAVMGYADYDPYLTGRGRITLDPYHAMHGGGPGSWSGTNTEEEYWDTQREEMARTLAHEYSHLRRPTEEHAYERGPSYGDPQEVASSVWQALGETQDPERYRNPTIEDALNIAEAQYSTRANVDENVRESLMDEIELFLKQPIFEGHRIVTGSR